MHNLRSFSTAHGRRVLISSAAIQSLAFMSLWLQPSMVAELVGERGIAIRGAGLIATTETLIISLMLLLAVRWRRIFYYRAATLAGVALTVLATTGCLYATGFPAFLALRAIAALGFGLLMLVPNMALAGFEKPDVVFGRVYATNLAFSAALLFLLPYIGRLTGSPPAFPTFLLFMAVMLPFVLMMPGGEYSPPRELLAKSGDSLKFGARQIIVLAAGSAAVGLAFGQVWAFFMLLGKEAGLSGAQSSTASSLALVGAIVGSLLSGRANASVQGLNLFRLSILGMVIGLLTVLFSPLPGLFVVGGVVAMFGMYFFFPTVLAAAASYDASGRGISLINGALSLLSATGPVVAGFLIEAGGRTALSIVTVSALAAAFFLFEWVWRDRRSSGPLQAV